MKKVMISMNNTDQRKPADVIRSTSMRLLSKAPVYFIHNSLEVITYKKWHWQRHKETITKSWG